MEEIVVDFNTWIRTDFVFIVPILIGVGLILKYRTPQNNKLIPLFLFAVAFPLASIWGFVSSQYLGGARWFDALIIAGVSQGFVCTASAVMIYGSFHGAKRVLRESKNLLKEDSE